MPVEKKTTSCDELIERLDEVLGSSNTANNSQVDTPVDCGLDELLNS